MLTVTKEQLIQRALNASHYMDKWSAESMARESLKDAQPETEDATVLGLMDYQIAQFLKIYAK